MSVSLSALLIWALLALAGMARRGVDLPARALITQLPSRCQLLILPMLVQPLFFAAFTAAKTSIAPLVSFTWDGFFTHLDVLIFTEEPWRLTHVVIGSAGSHMLELFYTAIWGLSLVYVQAFIAICGSRRYVGIFFLALNLTWLSGGIMLAFATPAAGPIFAHLFDPALGAHFKALHATLAVDLDPDGPIVRTQHYLTNMLGKLIAKEGGGISAMPSMHVATAMLYVVAARGTGWFWPAIVFAVLTCIGSVHFGYHYGVDGIVAIAIAGLCWRGAEIWFSRPSRYHSSAPVIARDGA